jgi:hypothetical protein
VRRWAVLGNRAARGTPRATGNGKMLVDPDKLTKIVAICITGN